MAAPGELVGSFVVEFGARQVWPFLTLCDNHGTPSIERRLFIESGIEVRPARPVARGDSVAAQVQALSSLNGLTITFVSISDDNTLIFSFTEGATLVVDGEAGPETSVDAWWIA